MAYSTFDYCKLVDQETDHTINAACKEFSTQIGFIEQQEAQRRFSILEIRKIELKATESIIRAFLTHSTNPSTLARLNERRG